MSLKNPESAGFPFALASVALALALVLTIPASARADGAALTSIGPRVGFGFDPDQVVFGGQMEVTGFAPDFSFQPVLELGIGDNVTVVATSFDVLYSFRLEDSDWRPFAGAGIGVDFFNSDRRPPSNNESATEAGLNLLVGTSIPARSGTPMFVEMRIGLGALPEVKGMLGWNFSL